MKKRLFSILLVLCMALTMLPVTALAEVVSSGTYDIAINGTKWKFEENDSGECIPVYYYKDYTFNTKAGYGFHTNDNLVLTKVGNTVTISFRRGTGYQSYYHQVKFTIESEAEGSDISCIEMGNGNNLVITGEGTKGTLELTRNGKDGIGDALSSKVGNITITGGATVKVTFNKQKSQNVNGHAIFVDNHDLIISGQGTTVEATNQSCATRGSSNDATVRVANGKIIVSDGARLEATNTFTNNNIDRYDYFSSAISGDKNALCTVSVTGENSCIKASANNSTKADIPMGQAYRWAKFEVDSAKIEVGNSSYPLTEGAVDDIERHQYVTISVPTAPAPHTHTFGDTWTSDATDHWHACTASDCNNDIDAIKDKAPHIFGDWIIDKEPNATEAGSKHKECTVCQYKTQTETIPATGPCTHENSTWVPADDGVHHVNKCAKCGAELATEEHNFAYRDNENNSHTMTCSTCGASYTRGHNFNNKIVPAEDGKHRGQCICGAYGAAEDHTYQNGKCTACGAADPTYVPPTDPAPVEPTPGGSVIIITPEATGPAFLSGANQTVAVGGSAVFRIDYNYAAFRSVAVDGVTLTPADYTTWEGSTWVKLTPAYVKTLGIGTHTLSVYFDGATAATTFTVGSQPNPATGARDAVGIAAAAAVIALLGSAALLRKK